MRRKEYKSRIAEGDEVHVGEILDTFLKKTGDSIQLPFWD